MTVDKPGRFSRIGVVLADVSEAIDRAMAIEAAATDFMALFNPIDAYSDKCKLCGERSEGRLPRHRTSCAYLRLKEALDE